jgi:ABC-type multidrug transport system fused ATPase/permease subunit
VLKLVMRLYEPAGGQILVDGKDIKTLKLADLRQTISVLFQDYTHFPLSVSALNHSRKFRLNGPRSKTTLV